MDYTTEPAVLPGFGQVEKVLVDGHWVGMVYRDPSPPEEMDELWMAYTQGGGHGVDSREAGVHEILQHAAANPDFEME
jgi:hypothetical protein